MTLRNFIQNAIGGLSVSLALSSVATAEELTILDGRVGEPRVALFWGEVLPGSAARLENLLDLNPDVQRIMMVSPGGTAIEGFRIAEVLSNRKMKAMVPNGYACLSACAIGFIGAEEYFVNGILGFHNMHMSEEAMLEIPSINLLLAGQNFGTRSTVFFIANGFEVELPVLIGGYTNPDTFLVFSSTEDLMEFFARSETDKIEEYLEANDIDSEWLETHLWGPDDFAIYFGGNI